MRKRQRGKAVDYYERFAAEFFDSTVDVDMAELHGRFLQALPARAHILDAGCGSGRDAKAFSTLGHKVSAFDASEAMAQRASALCGFDVAVRRFQEVDELACYDGVWCCASLLHVPRAEMESVLAKLWRAVRPGGCIYVSFKHGKGERDHDGRRFTDADEAQLREWLGALPELKGLEVWTTADQWAAAGSVDTDLSFSSLLKLYRADVAERRVSPSRVVEALDVVEHISPNLLTRAVRLGRGSLRLQ